MPTHTISQSWARAGETLTSPLAAITADGEANGDPDVAPGAANAEFDLTFGGGAALKSILITANFQVTIKVNSTSTPDLTLTWGTSGGWFEWDITKGTVNPLPNPVTKFYFSSSPGGTVKIRALHDIGP